jgi:addiction module HigA family antidote
MIMHNPAHPGAVLQEYMANVEVTSFAQRLGVSRTTLSRLLHGHTGVSAPMALRLAAALKTSPQLWMNLQVQYDLWHAMQAEKAARRKARTAAPSRLAAKKAKSKRSPTLAKAA